MASDIKRRLRSLFERVIVSWAFNWYLKALDSLGYPSQKAIRRARAKGKVSIPIATYDRIETLEKRTLPNLLQQSYKDIEIIVVGDGTPIRLLKRLELLDQERIRVKALRRRSRYPRNPLDLWFVAGSRPRNVEVKLARGEFLLWMSDDDYLAPDAIEKLVSFMRKFPDIDAVGGVVQIGCRDPIFNVPDENPDLIGHTTGAMPGWLWRSYLGAFRWNTNSWRKTWNRPADYDLWERMQRLGVRFGAINHLVAVQPESEVFGEVGSRNAVREELERRRRSSSRGDSLSQFERWPAEPSLSPRCR